MGTPMHVPPSSHGNRFPMGVADAADDNGAFRTVERTLRYLSPRRRSTPALQNEVGLLVHAAMGGSYRGFCLWILWMFDFEPRPVALFRVSLPSCCVCTPLGYGGVNHRCRNCAPNFTTNGTRLRAQATARPRGPWLATQYGGGCLSGRAGEWRLHNMVSDDNKRSEFQRYLANRHLLPFETGKVRAVRRNGEWTTAVV